MKRGIQLLSGLLVIAIAIATAQAQTDRGRIVRAKRATALLLEKSGKKAATAVCINELGVFITNSSAVAGIGRGGKVELLLNPNEDDEVTISASVAQLFEKRGFAVIQAEKSRKYEFLPLGDDASLLETMAVTAFGYRVDERVFVSNSPKPSVLVNVCHITSLEKQSGKLRSIHLDCELPAGCAGGPVVDSKGRIIGIVSAGRAEGRASTIIPVSHVNELVAKPEVLVQLPENLSDSSEFQIQLVWPLGDLRDLSVELQLENSDGSSQAVPSTKSGTGKFVFKTPAIIRRQSSRPMGIPATIHFSNAKLECTLADRTFQISGKTFRLSSVSKFEFAGTRPANITLRKGMKLSGDVVGLNRVPVNLGGYTFDLDLQRAERIDLRRSESQLPVAYVVIVKRRDSMIHQLRGDLDFPDESQNSAAATPRFTPYQGDTQRIKLPDTIHDAFVGRAGRYLLLLLRTARKLAVYDVNAVEVVRYLSLDDENVQIAAGLEHLFVVYPDQNRIERWSLMSFEKELAAKLPIQGVVRAIAMGNASYGPLLVHWSSARGAGGRPSFTFFNVDTLKPLVIAPFRLQKLNNGDNVHMRSAASGDVFGIWCTNRSPQGMETLTLARDRVSLDYLHESGGYVVPTADGTGILTQTRGLYSVNLRRIRSTPLQSEQPCFPSTHDRYYVTVPVTQAARRANSGRATKVKVGAVNATNSGEPLVPLPQFEEFSKLSNPSWNQNDFTFDKRIHYVVQADQIVSIPFSNDQLVVRRFSLSEAHRKLGQDYLYVSSVPSPRFIPGEIYQYSIDVVSSRKSVKFKLINGPDGMTISDTGELLWTVPANWPEQVTRIILSVSNAAAASTYQSIKIKRHRR